MPKTPTHFVEVRRTAVKFDEQCRMLAATILSGTTVGLAGSGAQVLIVGPDADRMYARAFLYAKEFLDAVD